MNHDSSRLLALCGVVRLIHMKGAPSHYIIRSMFNARRSLWGVCDHMCC